MFLALGFIFFLLVLSVEYFLWLNSTGRLVLLVLFIALEIYLLARFIIFPVIYLFRIKKGISEKAASLIIGKHFPEVDDKLFNLLELAEDKHKTELLLASIEQRSIQLQPIPFNKAINYRDNIKYARYLLVPLLIFLLIWISGNLGSFFGTYDRVVNYDVAFEPPAPFEFKVMVGNLRLLETEELTVGVATEGRIQPEEIFIVINERSYLMQRSDGAYHYTFSPPLKSSVFYFEANGYRTQNYRLEALSVPAIQDFTLILKYPAYIKKSDEIINSTGNATFPEGTSVKWEIDGKNTEKITLVSKDSVQLFEREEDLFSLSQKVYNDFNYQITTSNVNAEAYEKLNYKFKVIRDNLPSIRAREIKDSINPNVLYYKGEAADDYELVSLKIVCYPTGRKTERQELVLDKPYNNFKQFYYTFPSGLQFQEGENYDFYFEVTDNDGLRGGKTSKTQIFSTRILDDNELNNKQLDYQKSILDDLNKSLDNYKRQEESLEEINRDQKEKNNINFSDQNKIRDFLDKQERQEQMMQRFSRQLKENLEQSESDERLNKLLRERLERQEMEAKKNERLLEELKKIADKLEKEDLTKRLEELGKNQKNNERNLEQLLELTKRYYVTEKAAQLANDLEEVAKAQEALSMEKDSLSSHKQENLNKMFDDLSKELRDLEKDNQNLRKPLPLKIDENTEAGAKKDQQEALEELNKNESGGQDSDSKESDKNKNKASQKQKSAAQKILQMSGDLKTSSSMAAGASAITEDAEMLRQILDNLITFSFKQESLFEELEGKDLDVSYFSGVVKEQKELRGLFEHVDDSLFALSLRRAELSEFVNEQINEAYYNIDKSVESIVEGRIYQGVSYQQYVLTSANNLADFLVNLLDNMQQSMGSAGGSNGQGEDFQLPDIIKGQQKLGQKMGEMSEKGKGGQKGEEGSEGKEGEKEGEGEGDQSTDGSKGQNGKNSSKEGQQGGGNEQGDRRGSDGEESLEEIYEIYKEQQRLRALLEKQLEDMMRTRDKQLAQKLLQQMEDFENELLRNGITERTISRANAIEHQMLKLENAALEQGNKEERKSRFNQKEFLNPILTKPEQLQEIENDIEILNRQALPLHQIFQEKVKEYFNAKD